MQESILDIWPDFEKECEQSMLRIGSTVVEYNRKIKEALRILCELAKCFGIEVKFLSPGFFSIGLFFGLTIGILTQANAQVLESYQENWAERSTPNFWERDEQKEVWIAVNSFPESFFSFEVPSGTTMFVDGKLWKLFTRDSTFMVSVKELSNEFGKDSLLVSVIGKKTSFGGIPLRISKVVTSENQETAPILKNEADSQFVTRFLSQPIKDFYFSSILIILLLLGIYRAAYPYLLGVLLQPLAVINAEDFSESGSLQKVFSFDILFYLFIVSMMMAQSLVTGLLIYREDWIENSTGWDTGSLIVFWLSLSFVILILTILKFAVIRVISYLFDMGKSDFAHFFYLLRLIVFGFSVVLVASLFFVINDYSSLEPVFTFGMRMFFWFYILGVVGLFLIMMNRLSFKKYHLFTYLCIAEIVPFLILSKWIMVLGQ